MSIFAGWMRCPSRANWMISDAAHPGSGGYAAMKIDYQDFMSFDRLPS